MGGGQAGMSPTQTFLIRKVHLPNIGMGLHRGGCIGGEGGVKRRRNKGYILVHETLPYARSLFISGSPGLNPVDLLIWIGEKTVFQNGIKCPTIARPQVCKSNYIN